MLLTILKFLISYFILAFYFNFIPILFPMNDIIYLLHFLLFFPLAYMVSRILTKSGLETYGIVFFQGWKKNLSMGFLFGFSAWTILFLLYFILEKYEFTGINLSSNTPMIILAILVGFGLGSFISDMIVRGLVFYYFNELPVVYVMIIAIAVYALDDIWYAGLSFQNTVFSCALGLSLTYVFYKTNSIWASAGIHFGLNVVYGLFFGVSGKAGEGILLFESSQAPPTITYWLSTMVSILLFISVYKYRFLFLSKRNDRG
ncbi:type II CAAX prenyl endopeptidase Rce1 family protein [Cytobacillus sp. FJAT-54145]|uniref:Type II CAAX prenyl endopeptidase Rce1 family protein n=1 Tax=Cytobacillus spartinae TaxID=3299023 RepID=A0ABW6KBJ7_9BACI